MGSSLPTFQGQPIQCNHFSSLENALTTSVKEDTPVDLWPLDCGAAEAESQGQGPWSNGVLLLLWPRPAAGVPGAAGSASPANGHDRQQWFLLGLSGRSPEPSATPGRKAFVVGGGHQRPTSNTEWQEGALSVPRATRGQHSKAPVRSQWKQPARSSNGCRRQQRPWPDLSRGCRTRTDSRGMDSSLAPRRR